MKTRDLLFVVVSLFVTAPAVFCGPVNFGLFKLFQSPILVLETQESTLVVFKNRSTRTQKTLVCGQSLLIMKTKGGLSVRIQERGDHLLFDSTAIEVDCQKSLYTLRLPGRLERQFTGEIVIPGTDPFLIPRVSVSLEIAVLQVLRSEMSAAAPLDALKAQAIVIRSYLQAAKPRHPDEKFDFCDTTHCQYFTGFSEVDDKFVRAVRETKGLNLTFRGKVFPPLYTEACGGVLIKQSDSIPSAGIPVHCSYCSIHRFSSWSSRISIPQFTAVLLERSDESVDSLQAFIQKFHGSDMNSAQLLDLRHRTRIRVGRSIGWNVIHSDWFNFDLSSDHVEVTGLGSGHNSGLCQWGTIEQAKQGRSYLEILKFYFPQAEVEPGPLDQELTGAPLAGN